MGSTSLRKNQLVARVAPCYFSFLFRGVQPPLVSTELANSLLYPHNLHLPLLSGPSAVSIIQWYGQPVAVLIVVLLLGQLNPLIYPTPAKRRKYIANAPSYAKSSDIRDVKRILGRN